MSPRKNVALALVAIVLIGAAGALTAYQVEIRRIRAKVLAGGQIAETAAGQIEYAIAGTGTPLLSIHGADGGYDQGLLIAAALMGDGFEAIAPSRFGYLRTPVPSDASPAAQADAYAALLDVLGVDRVIVVGVSAGTPSAMQLALRHPGRVAALVLVSPLGYAPGGQAPLPANEAVLKVIQIGADFAYWTMLHVAPSAMTRLMGVPPELLDKVGPDDRRWATSMLRSGLPLSKRVAGVTNDISLRSLMRFDAWPLERIAAPTLILTSSDDLFHTQPAAEYAAAHIPDAKLVVYPTGGHLLIGHSSDVRSVVAAFLKQALPDRLAANAIPPVGDRATR
jgi:2-hydroxy-6-oxonona-2,4-dienedioate hydrolase